MPGAFCVHLVHALLNFANVLAVGCFTAKRLERIK